MFVLSTVLVIMYQLIDRYIFHRSIEVISYNYIIIDFICNILLVIWILFVCYKDIKESVLSYKFSFKGIMERIWIFISTYLITFFANAVVGLWIRDLGVVSKNQESFEELILSNKVLISVSVLCLAPIIEEVIFRWYIFGLIKNKIYAVLISSLLFAFLHCVIQILSGDMNGIIAMIPFFITSLGFSITYLRTKKITYSIVFHILWNLMAIL